MAHQALLPMDQLSDKAHQTDVLPALKDNSLLSVKVFSDSGYTTVFHPYDKGATVHALNSFEIHTSVKPLLHRHRDKNGMWKVPSITSEQTDDEEMLINDKQFHQHAIHNVYKLPSTEKMILFLHTALGFPTNSTLIKAINNGHLNTFPSLTVANVNKFFPESSKTQKCHLKQQHQGTRSTKILKQPMETPIKPGIKHKDVYLRISDATKRSMYTSQTG